MFKLMGKEINAILGAQAILIWIYEVPLVTLKTVTTLSQVKHSTIGPLHSSETHNIDPDKDINERKIVIIFLPINLNMCFEYPQHMFWMRN